jgi:uncharacterized protein (DUF1800 family)/fibronectin type 3 domain-containing protein
MVTLTEERPLADDSLPPLEIDILKMPAGLGLMGMSLGLTACGGGGSGETAAVPPPPVAVTPPPVVTVPAPATPSSVVAQAASTKVVLTWPPLSSAASYEVRRSTISGGPYTLIGNPVTASFTDTGLVNGLSYFYVVAAVNAGGTSAFSSEMVVQPLDPVQVPVVPTALTAAAGNAQVNLSWTGVAGATSYQIKRSTLSGGPYNAVATAAGTSFLDGGLTNGVTYFYVVAAIGSAGTSANSAQVSASPAVVVQVPPAPTGVVGSPGNALALLNWQASPGATSYQVKRARSNTEPFVLVASPTTPAYTDTGLVNGTPYLYVVLAVNAAGASASSIPVSVTPAQAVQIPAAPTGLSAVAGNAQVTLSWTASPGAATYQIKRSLTGFSPFTFLATPSATTFTDVGLTNGTTYYYAIAAVNSAGPSVDSLLVNAIPKSPEPMPVPVSANEAARFLLQAQFSASDAEIAAVRAKGFKVWLNEQFATPATQTGFSWLDARGYGQVDSVFRYYDNSYPGDYMIWNQLMTSSDTVRKRCALALSEFFVVSLNSLDFSWRSHGIAAWWDLLVAHAFGNYRQLLEAVTLNPAMGYYLNTKGNKKEDVARNRVPDENYGREVMQLFSLGLYVLNQDGTEKRDGSGNRIETYTQSDITNIARVFTGWDIDQSQNVPTLEPVQNRTIPSTHFTRLPMALTAANHSALASTFLGATVPAGTAGVPALKIALDTLFNHPNVAPFFGKQMIQRLVTSNPSPAYVARVAAAFNDNGAGVRGDLKAVFAAVLLDDEARNANGLAQAGFGKLREPMLRLVQWGRTFGISSARGSWKIGNLSNPGNQLSQSPLRSPSVFNFFRPGYVPPGTALSASKTPAPEFQLVNESGVGAYLNYMQGVIRNGIFVGAPDQAGNGSNATNGYDITAAYTAELALVLDPAALVARLNLLLCAGQLSAANQTLIVNALNATALTSASSDSAKRDRVAAAVLLVMASSEYLIQK